MRDLGSRNGTFVNGEELHDAQRPLAPRQIVKFGAVEARLKSPAAQPQTPPPTSPAIHFHAREVASPSMPCRRPRPSLDDGAATTGDDQTLILPRPPVSPAGNFNPPPCPR